MDAIADDIVFRPAWRLNDKRIVQAVKEFWLRQNIPPLLTNGREGEICAAAYSGDEIAAVSTASVFYYPLMRNKFFVYRCLVAPQFRQRNLSWRISAYSFELLQDWSAQNAHEKILGLMIIVETDKFAVPQRKPVRENLGITLNFVGYTPAGEQVRIVWFDNAELDNNAERD